MAVDKPEHRRDFRFGGEHFLAILCKLALVRRNKRSNGVPQTREALLRVKELALVYSDLKRGAALCQLFLVHACIANVASDEDGTESLVLFGEEGL